MLVQRAARLWDGNGELDGGSAQLLGKINALLDRFLRLTRDAEQEEGLRLDADLIAQADGLTRCVQCNALFHGGQHLW